MAVAKKEATSGWEWRMRVDNETLSKVMSPEEGPYMISRVLLGLKERMFSKPLNFLKKAWDLACNDPRKVIHCLKVGLALTAVSLFYYVRPLYDGVGGNAMWAVMTVVVVCENTVGATLSKSLNRICGTFLAGFIAVGVHWVAIQAGEKSEPFIMGVSVFILASAATFSRFIPTIKARFDYGCMIFILTFSFVSVSGYRIDKLFDMARQRLSTVFIGTSLCIIISIIICPIWAGQELHTLITRNMDKLANSLDGCVAEYFISNEEDSTGSQKGCGKNLLGYKCVLNSKAPEESMANIARWEPAHGRFNFRHPWKQYLKMGTEMRGCAYCIEALNGCISSENKAPEHLKTRVSNICLELSSNSSSVIKELASIVKTMKKSSSIDFLAEQMNSRVQGLRNELKFLPSLVTPETPKEAGNVQDSKKTKENSVGLASASLMEIVPLATLTSLLIENAARIEGIVDAVEELADLAQFKPVADDEHIEDETMKTLQRG
ncbi:Aluminum-activated malate transporter 10 [Morus notabilis]|uniref:Aluminum-activated malate transporter 10 n=1 Tax=Morus notabilis TaxID=981085 RepID=W9SHU3_9ROSA|nr:aluminum-activated malate transporter 10 [Morus notabilis]EXC07933.1 Aluminum-activated malate transporter 10 [Morus notabilis]